MPKYQPKNIQVSKIRPHLRELILRCGSPEKAANYIGMGTTTMYRLRHGENQTMQMTTAQLILDGLMRKREEDRKNGHTSEALTDALQIQARIERNLEDMTGY